MKEKIKKMLWLVVLLALWILLIYFIPRIASQFQDANGPDDNPVRITYSVAGGFVYQQQLISHFFTILKGYHF